MLEGKEKATVPIRNARAGIRQNMEVGRKHLPSLYHNGSRLSGPLSYHTKIQLTTIYGTKRLFVI